MHESKPGERATPESRQHPNADDLPRNVLRAALNFVSYFSKGGLTVLEIRLMAIAPESHACSFFCVCGRQNDFFDGNLDLRTGQTLASKPQDTIFQGLRSRPREHAPLSCSAPDTIHSVCAWFFMRVSRVCSVEFIPLHACEQKWDTTSSSTLKKNRHASKISHILHLGHRGYFRSFCVPFCRQKSRRCRIDIDVVDGPLQGLLCKAQRYVGHTFFSRTLLRHRVAYVKRMGTRQFSTRFDAHYCACKAGLEYDN